MQFHQQIERAVQRFLVEGAETFVQQHIAETRVLTDRAHFRQTERERQTDLETFASGKIACRADHVVTVMVDHVQFQRIVPAVQQREMAFQRFRTALIGQCDEFAERVPLRDGGESFAGAGAETVVQIFPVVAVLPEFFRFLDQSRRGLAVLLIVLQPAFDFVETSVGVGFLFSQFIQFGLEFGRVGVRRQLSAFPRQILADRAQFGFLNGRCGVEFVELLFEHGDLFGGPEFAGEISFVGKTLAGQTIMEIFLGRSQRRFQLLRKLVAEFLQIFADAVGLGDGLRQLLGEDIAAFGGVPDHLIQTLFLGVHVAVEFCAAFLPERLKDIRAVFQFLLQIRDLRSEFGGH